MAIRLAEGAGAAAGADLLHLEAPLREISALCAELGYRAPDVRVAVRSGDLVFGDVDGVVVIPREHEREVVARAIAKFSGENASRDALLTTGSSPAA